MATAAATSPSHKRKASVEEIEVDLALPEPPSKKARRALKKGKSLPEKPKSDDEDEKPDSTNANKKDDKPARSEHGIWVGNLPFTVTATELRKWLVDNSGGVITDEHVTRIKLPVSKVPGGRDRDVQGERAKPGNKGFAYVDFSELGAKVAAIALSETDLGGRKLLIKDSTSFEGRPQKVEPEAVAAEGEDNDSGGRRKQDSQVGGGSKVAENASRKVFVGNMGFQTSEEDVRRNFEKCGDIEWVKIAQFEDSGKCKGYGWIMFRDPEAAAWAVKGFVKIKERIETEDDFRDDDSEQEDGGDAADDRTKTPAKKQPQQQEKQFKTRKWWVNRMMGRELKLELAEDDAVRYKKRFGKDAKQRSQDEQRGNGQNRGPRSGNRTGESNDRKSGDRRAEPLKEASDIGVARLTGAVVKHTGTKMTFD